jgi:hypothetical protein
LPIGPEDGRIVAYDPPLAACEFLVRYANRSIERNGGTLVDIGRGHFALKDKTLSIDPFKALVASAMAVTAAATP